MREAYRRQRQANKSELRTQTSGPSALPRPRAGLIVTLDPLRVRIVAGDVRQERELRRLARAVELLARGRERGRRVRRAAA